MSINQKIKHQINVVSLLGKLSSTEQSELIGLLKDQLVLNNKGQLRRIDDIHLFKNNRYKIFMVDQESGRYSNTDNIDELTFLGEKGGY